MTSRPIDLRALIGAENFRLDDLLRQIECELVQEALRQSKGRKYKAAALLGIERRSMRYRCAKLKEFL